jgi:hypothetical protein
MNTSEIYNLAKKLNHTEANAILGAMSLENKARVRSLRNLGDTLSLAIATVAAMGAPREATDLEKLQEA